MKLYASHREAMIGLACKINLGEADWTIRQTNNGWFHLVKCSLPMPRSTPKTRARKARELPL